MKVERLVKFELSNEELEAINKVQQILKDFDDDNICVIDTDVAWDILETIKDTNLFEMAD